MSEQEMLVLSTKDRDRLKVLHEVKGEHLTQRAAAPQLGISDRWLRKLLGRMKKEGERGVVHRLRGRVSKRGLRTDVGLRVPGEAAAGEGEQGHSSGS